jgi:hypothetical protein
MAGLPINSALQNGAAPIEIHYRAETKKLVAANAPGLALKYISNEVYR